eukprot:m.23153 g.23153  ORF g.23153 m.23153 type:complete len:50 (+) comp10931_c0_seq1:1805-1954(+)
MDRHNAHLHHSREHLEMSIHFNFDAIRSADSASCPAIQITVTSMDTLQH